MKNGMGDTKCAVLNYRYDPFGYFNDVVCPWVVVDSPANKRLLVSFSKTPNSFHRLVTLSLTRLSFKIKL